MDSQIELSVIILAFRSYDKLAASVRAVFSSRTDYKYEVIVVDNGSADGTAERFVEEFGANQYPNLKLIRNQNEGFAKGNNLGIINSSGKYVLLLNPDTSVQPDTIQLCMDYIIANKYIGALGCKLIKSNGKLDPACRRSFPNPANSLYRFLLLPKFFPNSKRISSYNMTYAPEDEILDVDSLSGAFMLMPRTLLNKVGLLDESYFMYGEDIDLCYKIKQAGYRVVYFPKTFTYHYKGQSSKKAPYSMLYYFHESMWIFYKKHYAKKYPVIMNRLVYSGIWLRFAALVLGNALRKEKFVSK
jgi:GT2 family glycosyltransferase